MTTHKSLRSLRVLDSTLRVVRQLAPLVREISRCDADLADQLRRAATSICLNLNEGNASQGGNRKKHFYLALGSTREVRGALAVAEAWGYIANVASLDRELDIIGAMTWRLIGSR